MNKQVLRKAGELATAQWLAQGRVITKCRASLAPVCIPAPPMHGQLDALLALMLSEPRQATRDVVVASR